MSTSYLPSYLERLNAFPENFACFIPRLPGIEVSTDREAVIAALTPEHEAIMRKHGIEPRFLRRAQQVHGNRVALVGDIGCSYPVEGVDGLFCGGVADCCLGIYVADCAAVWVYDTVSGARGLVHSGKMGTAQNIVGEQFERMRKTLGVKAADCIAVISPCIRKPDYEVDIAEDIKAQLAAAGLKQENIIDSGLNTAADLDTFYSYRVEKGNTGRMLALFGRLPGADADNSNS